MSWRKLFDRAKNAGGDLMGGIGDAAGGAGDIVQQAKQYLDDNAGGPEAVLGATVRGLAHATPGGFLADTGLLPGADLLPGALRSPVPANPADFLLHNPQAADVATIGHQGLLDPLLGLARNRPGQRPVNPLSGENIAATEADIGGIGNPLLRGTARAGLAGAEIATNPLTYVGTGNLPLAAQLGLGAAGIGGFGGEGAAVKAARAAIMGGAMTAGAEAGDATDIPFAGTIGGLGAAALTHRVGSATPGLGRPTPLGGPLDPDALRAADARLAQPGAPPVETPMTDTPTSFHAGIPLPLRAVVGGGIGAGVGALLPADSTDERERRAAAGFGLGAGVALAGPALIQKLAGRAPTTPVVPPSAPALTDYSQFLAQSQLRVAAALDRITNPDPTMRRQGTELILNTRDAVNQGRLEAAGVRQAGNAFGAALTRGLADGSVTPTAEELARQQAQMAAIPVSAAATRTKLAQYYQSGANVAQHPAGFVAGTPETQLALAAIDNAHVAQRAMEQATGLDVGELEGGYLSQAGLWERPAASSAVRGRPVGASQGFQKGRVLEDIGAGIAAGYTPKTLDIGDMLAGRIQAGVTAAAHQQLVNVLAESPQTMVTRPFVEWDAATAKQNGYVRADLNNAVLAKLRAEAPAGAGDLPYLRPDVARALNAWAGPPADLGPLNALQDVAKVTRFGLFMLNLAHVARVGSVGAREEIGAQIQNPFNPVDYARAATLGPAKAAGSFYGALATALSDDKMALWARDDAPRWGQARLQTPGGDNPVTSIAGRGQPTGMLSLLDRGPMKGIHDWIFQRFLPVYMTKVADDLEQNYGRGGYGDLIAEQIHTRIARAVDATIQGADPVRLGLSQPTQAIARLAELAPMWRAGRFQQIAQAGMPGLEGDMARKYWVTSAVLGVSAAAGLTVALSDERDPRKLAELIDPRQPNSVTNPLSPSFLAVALPGGQRVQLLGVDTAMAKAVLTPFTHGIGEGFATADEARAANAAQYGAVRGGIYTALTSLGQAVSNTGASTGKYAQYAESGLSVPVKLIEQIIRNRDSLSHPIATDAGFGPRTRQVAGYAAAQTLPLFAQPFSQDQPVPPGVEGPTRRDRALAGLTSFGAEQLGTRVTQPSYDPAPLKDKAQAFLAGQGVNGGADPLGELRANRDIPVTAKDHFLATNDDVRQYLANKRSDLSTFDLPAGKDAAQLFNHTSAGLEGDRDAAIRAAAGGNLTGNDFRKAVTTAWTNYLAGRQALGKTYLGTSDLTGIQAKLDDALGGRDLSTSPLDRAIDQYEAIRTPVGQEEDPAARDAMLSARRQFIGAHPEVADALRERYRKVGGTTYATYFDAQQVMGRYAEISPSLVMDAAAARRAQAVVGRAQDARGYGSPLPLSVLVLIDPQATEADRTNALLLQSSGLRNPEKRTFMQLNARQMVPFYSGLNDEYAQSLVY